MLSSGLDEMITTSLIGKPLLDKYMQKFNEEKAVKVLNSASEESTMLRQGMAASVLNCMKYNYDNGQKTFWAYEIGKKYLVVNPADEKSSGIKESRVLAGILTGEVENSNGRLKLKLISLL